MRAWLPGEISDRDIDSKAARQATSFSFHLFSQAVQLGLHSSLGFSHQLCRQYRYTVGLSDCAQYKQCHITQSNLPINQLIFAQQSQPVYKAEGLHSNLFVCLQSLLVSLKFNGPPAISTRHTYTFPLWPEAEDVSIALMFVL